MANMYITEYADLATTANGLPIQAGKEPALAQQTVSFTTSTQSSALNAKTRLVRITCDAEAFLKFGENPTATATGTNVQADTPEFFGIGGKNILIAAYDGTS